MTPIQDQRVEAVEITRKALLARLDRYLPDELYRGYYRWALSEENPDQQVFDRIIALTQLGNLTAAMLTNLDGPDDWRTLLHHAVPVNLYQIFEVISDNLGLGLARIHPDETSELRDLVLGFNAVAAEDLRRPTSTPAKALLAHLKVSSTRVSSFTQSLAAPFHALTTEQYQAKLGNSGTNRSSSLKHLEHSVWSGLVANIESGRDVLNAIAGTLGEPQVRVKTIERYKAVDKSLTTQQLSREELVLTSTQTVLVTPTLGYFATVFGELSAPDSGYREALADGSLTATFDTASLLVRLQNDVGTPLLRMSPHDRAALLRKLTDKYRIDSTKPDTAIALLTRAVSEPELNRFRKDVLNGEFNICLYDVYRADRIDNGVKAGNTNGLEVFQDGLDYLSDLYSQKMALLDQQLDALDQRLHDHRIIEVTRRFVHFHEKLYSHRYDDLAGDYAI